MLEMDLASPIMNVGLSCPNGSLTDGGGCSPLNGGWQRVKASHSATTLMASRFFGSSFTRMLPLRIWLTGCRYRLTLSGGLGTSAAAAATRRRDTATATDRDGRVMKGSRAKGRGLSAQRLPRGGVGATGTLYGGGYQPRGGE